METAKLPCPVCGRCLPCAAIDAHVNWCLNQQEHIHRETGGVEVTSAPRKRLKADDVPTDCNDHHQKIVAGIRDFFGGMSHINKPLSTHKMSPKHPPLQPNRSNTKKTVITNDLVVKTTQGCSAEVTFRTWQGISEGSVSDSVQNHHVNIKMSESANKKPVSPLAEEMRPKFMEDYIGQEEVLGKKTLLRTLLDTQQIPSMVIWGPPGCGKTTLARIIAAQTKCSSSTRIVQLSATTSGISDVKDVIKVAKNDQAFFKRKTILFVDEIHRFNKIQQDSFLPHVEDGTITLIGATTENPSFHVNNALLSRCRVVTLGKLSVENVEQILTRAVDRLGAKMVSEDTDKIKDTHSDRVCIEEKAITTLAHLCDGDARVALNSLESAVGSARTRVCHIVGVEDVKEGLQRSHIQYDRAGEEHYNCISAMIKSMRGSDHNAAIYWLSRMLEGGEDPKFVARRLIIFASEDIGVADSQSLSLGVATYQACLFIGMPECALNLAHCVVHMSRAPKSVEAYTALKKACECIRQHQGALPSVPLHLRNAPTKMMKEMNYGVGYQYNPACTGPVTQDYLPQELLGVNFFAKDAT